MGFLGAFCANFATRLKFALHVDETLDIFAVHCVGGFVGVSQHYRHLGVGLTVTQRRDL